ncbi:MAG: hypothetical protein OER04_14240 [Cyclobacteriaceae bacterium]|nr:hypothetical protein [Cyclobacteriaceae bacterium]
MDILIEFAKLLIPAGAVLYGMYLVVKSFVQKELNQAAIELRSQNHEIALPMRLQAYERICLFLERIAPNNLVLRLRDNAHSAREFQHVLVNHIREEYNHNLSQQIYISDQAWELVKNAKEEVIAAINQSAQGLPEQANSLDLAKRIFDGMMQKGLEPTTHALLQIKQEVRTLF